MTRKGRLFKESICFCEHHHLPAITRTCANCGETIDECLDGYDELKEFSLNHNCKTKEEIFENG